MADFPEMTQGRVWSKPRKRNIPGISNGEVGGADSQREGRKVI